MMAKPLLLKYFCFCAASPPFNMLMFLGFQPFGSMDVPDLESSEVGSQALPRPATTTTLRFDCMVSVPSTGRIIISQQERMKVRSVKCFASSHIFLRFGFSFSIPASTPATADAPTMPSKVELMVPK